MNLSQTQMFHGISTTDCQRMVDCFGATERHFITGDTIFDYNQPSSLVGLIKTGSASLIRIDIYGIRTILEQMQAGSVFGETLAFSGQCGDSLSVLCEEDATVLFFEYDRITHPCGNACSHHIDLLQNMFRLISKKTVALSQRVEILSRRSIREKLLCYFSLQALRQGNRKFELPFSVSALADYICSDRSAMMREMKNMRQENLIATDGRKITLLSDPSANY